MALTKYKLGSLIQLEDERNTAGQYTLGDVKGISIQKKFIETRADMQGVSLTPYILVKPGCFAYVTVTSRNGEKITLAHNTTSDTYIVSSSYVVFSVSKPEVLNADYLFIYFNRPEFDRYARFNSWGSARETFSWEGMCDIDIELPSLAIQQKYVDVYKAMLVNQRSYERGLDDLKLTCDAYIENLRRELPCEEIGKYIFKERKNSEGQISQVLGIGQNGFMKPQKSPNESLKNYKVLHDGDIAYAPPLYNVLTGALHCYRGKATAVCSPIYEVFGCDERKLLPEYLTMWLKREEFKRYAAYYALGVRQTFDYQLMEEVKIPIPGIPIQQSVVNLYRCYLKRKEINEQLKNKLKDVCPILIKGSLEEAKREEAHG